MTQSKFVIPQKLDDLSHPQDDSNIYYVNNELASLEIAHQLAETESKLHQDPLNIIDEFGVFYSVLRTFDTLDTRLKDRFWTILFKTTNSFSEQLRSILSTENAQSLFDSAEEKLQYSNALKMIIFLDCTFIQFFEDAQSSHKHNFDKDIAGGDQGRKRKDQTANKKKAAISLDYEKYRVRVLKDILQLISSPLSRISDSSTEAQEVANQVMRVSYKMIENSAINHLTKDNDLININFSLVGCGIEKYNQSLTFCLKFIQLLQQREQLAPLLADLVSFIVSRHDQRQLVSDIIREIAHIDIRSLTADSSGTRAVSAFLISLSEKCSEEFLPSIDELFDYLEQDSYHMRSTTLSIFGNLIIKTLHKQDADKDLRDRLLDVMLDHICDITTFTRSRALQVWATLCENQMLPLSYLVPVTTAAVGRLLDKSCPVRKSAVRFITTILMRNPFARKLPLQAFVQKYEQENKKLEELIEEERKRLEKEEEVLETLSQDSQTSINSDTDPSQVHPNAKVTKDVVLTSESAVVTQKRKVDFLRDAIAFTQQIHKAIPLTSEMLYSEKITDISEAIEFFVCSYEFGIDEALVGFKKMILLVNGKEKGYKETITAAYKRIFFESTIYEGKPNKDSLIVENLINFTQESTIGEFISLEVLMGHFYLSGDFTLDMERELMATFTRAKTTATIEDAIAAIQLIGSLALVKPDLINHNLHLCVKHGLLEPIAMSTGGSFDDQATRLVRETCIAIRKSIPRKIEDKSRSMRLARDDEIFVHIENIIVDSFTSTKSDSWFSMCDETIRILFDMAENPEKICESIFNKMVDKLLKNAIQCTNSISTQDTNRNESPDYVCQPSTLQGTQASQISNNTMELVNPTTLARFIHFLGDVALDLAVFLELNVLVELKVRTAPADESKHNISAANISISSRRRSRRFANKSMDEANLEDEIGLGGAEAEDAELEFIGSICDEEIVCGKNLLAKLARVVLEVAKDPIRYYHPELKQASSLALAKCMMVSARFCHDHLRLLFTILERTEDSAIKINLLVAISDLCIRFPNQLDGWTNKIFNCLQNNDVLVRRVALKILSRLILCDILKAKDQISTIANLIVDDDEQISSFARHFFVELSRKLNAIYNCLPDIISRLSDAKTGISEDAFRIVMKFIFELLDKAQQIDRLLDKLCGRFMDTDCERHWSDLAYCLSLLKYNDKSMAKLVDKFDCYKDKLCIDSVHESILSIVSTYKKNHGLKDEMKQLLAEFETKIAKAVGEKPEGEDMDATEGAGGHSEMEENGNTSHATTATPTPVPGENADVTETSMEED